MTAWTIRDPQIIGAREPERWRRVIVTLLVPLVLAGGIYPALYAGQLPHAHIFLGGRPPANWENHEHENPLVALFGQPLGARDQGDDNAAITPASDNTPAWADGRVVSVDTAAPLLILTVVGYGLIVPLLLAIAGQSTPARFVLALWRPTPRVAEAPVPPPPRQ